MKYRTWINEGDVVLVEPWDWQDEKANIEWRYSEQDAEQLRAEGHIDSLSALIFDCTLSWFTTT
ncbi:hypothetical protein C8039_06545 [Halogeometricum sp. wsp3]|nr:hypothetical protein C8039_06545 [Halogeometricum sp. wsp3]